MTFGLYHSASPYTENERLEGRTTRKFSGGPEVDRALDERRLGARRPERLLGLQIHGKHVLRGPEIHGNFL